MATAMKIANLQHKKGVNRNEKRPDEELSYFQTQ